MTSLCLIVELFWFFYNVNFFILFVFCKTKIWWQLCWNLMPQYKSTCTFSICGWYLLLRFAFLRCSDYSKKHIQEIYEDVNAFGLKSSNPNVVTNSHLAIAWLEATFPDLLHQSTDTSLLMSKAHPYAPVDDSLTLQVCFYFDFVIYLSGIFLTFSFSYFLWNVGAWDTRFVPCPILLHLFGHCNIKWIPF